jgi:hypothetical protein
MWINVGLTISSDGDVEAWSTFSAFISKSSILLNDISMAFSLKKQKNQTFNNCKYLDYIKFFKRKYETNVERRTDCLRKQFTVNTTWRWINQFLPSWVFLFF